MTDTQPTNYRPAVRFWRRWGGSLALGLFALGFMASLVATNRLALRDFEVYYTACQRLLWAEGPVYGEPFGLTSGYYKYAPVAALPFAPLSAMPLEIAQVIYYLLLTIGLMFGLPYVVRNMSRLLFQTDVPLQHWGPAVGLVLLPLLMHFHRELLLGNVNWWLVLLLMSHVLLLSQLHDLRAGAVLGAVLLIKPHFVVLLPLLVLRKRWRALAAVGVVLAAGLLLPLLWMGWQGNLDLLFQWKTTMQSHNSHDNLIAGPQTLFALIHKYILMGRTVQEGAVLVYGGLALTAISVFALFLRHHSLESKPNANHAQYTSHIALETMLLVALVPLLTLTDTEHFMYATPVIAGLLVAWRMGRLLGGWPVKLLIIIALLLYGGNWHDLWGHDLSLWIEQRGNLGFGTLMLCIIAALAIRLGPDNEPFMTTDKSVS